LATNWKKRLAIDLTERSQGKEGKKGSPITTDFDSEGEVGSAVGADHLRFGMRRQGGKRPE